MQIHLSSYKPWHNEIHVLVTSGHLVGLSYANSSLVCLWLFANSLPPTKLPNQILPYYASQIAPQRREFVLQICKYVDGASITKSGKRRIWGAEGDAWRLKVKFYIGFRHGTGSKKHRPCGVWSWWRIRQSRNCNRTTLRNGQILQSPNTMLQCFAIKISQHYSSIFPVLNLLAVQPWSIEF